MINSGSDVIKTVKQGNKMVTRISYTQLSIKTLLRRSHLSNEAENTGYLSQYQFSLLNNRAPIFTGYMVTKEK